MSSVSLREAKLVDAELLELWDKDPYRGEFNAFGDHAHDFRAAIERNGLIGDQRGNLIVEVDGTPVGTVSWHAEMYGPNPESLAWNIGINLIPEWRGHGYGAEAQRLLAERLLATTEANRIEAMTDVENVAEQRALEKAGFNREGVLRGAQFRGGAWHDLVVYSVVRAKAAE